MIVFSINSASSSYFLPFNLFSYFLPFNLSNKKTNLLNGNLGSALAGMSNGPLANPYLVNRLPFSYFKRARTSASTSFSKFLFLTNRSSVVQIASGSLTADNMLPFYHHCYAAYIAIYFKLQSFFSI